MTVGLFVLCIYQDPPQYYPCYRLLLGGRSIKATHASFEYFDDKPGDDEDLHGPRALSSSTVSGEGWALGSRFHLGSHAHVERMLRTLLGHLVTLLMPVLVNDLVTKSRQTFEQVISMDLLHTPRPGYRTGLGLEKE